MLVQSILKATEILPGDVIEVTRGITERTRRVEVTAVETSDAEGVGIFMVRLQGVMDGKEFVCTTQPDEMMVVYRFSQIGNVEPPTQFHQGRLAH